MTNSSVSILSPPQPGSKSTWTDMSKAVDPRLDNPNRKIAYNSLDALGLLLHKLNLPTPGLHDKPKFIDNWIKYE